MFSTLVNISHSPFEISYSDGIVALGSCFAENIGRKMTDTWFLTDVNPFSVLYNPISVKQGIELLLNDRQFQKTDLFEYQSLWHSFSHSSLFSDTTAENAVLNINERLDLSRQFFKQVKVLMITFGTAWVFEDTETGKVVSNCHKLPANRFSRYRLDVKQIVDEYIPFFISLKTINPELKIILTISPIRHRKDGVHENTLSKSTLHLAVDTLEKELPDVHYFPAYEIMMDELRDYRFYASDMLHPSDVAVDYIWQRFSETYFSANTRNLKIELEQLRADLNHRSLHPETKEYQQFIRNIEKRKSGLISMYSFLEKRMNK